MFTDDEGTKRWIGLQHELGMDTSLDGMRALHHDSLRHARALRRQTPSARLSSIRKG